MKRLLIFIITTIIIGYIVDFGLSSLLRNSNSGELGVMKEIHSGEINAEILIIGSSRALVHFNPIIIEEETGLTTYVIGINGMDFNMQKGLLDFYLKFNEPPKYLVVSLANLDLDYTQGPITQLSLIMYDNIPEINEALLKYEGYNKYASYIPMFKFNRQFAAVGRELKSIILGTDESYVNGYSAQNRDWVTDLEGEYQFSISINEEHVNLIDELIEENSVDSKIYFVYTPFYSLDLEDPVYNDYLNIYKTKVSENIYFDDYNLIIELDKNKFYNLQHLNSEGADLLSTAFSKKLITMIGEENDKSNN